MCTYIFAYFKEIYLTCYLQLSIYTSLTRFYFYQQTVFFWSTESVYSKFTVILLNTLNVTVLQLWLLTFIAEIHRLALGKQYILRQPLCPLYPSLHFIMRRTQRTGSRTVNGTGCHGRRAIYNAKASGEREGGVAAGCVCIGVAVCIGTASLVFSVYKSNEIKLSSKYIKWGWRYNLSSIIFVYQPSK